MRVPRLFAESLAEELEVEVGPVQAELDPVPADLVVLAQARELVAVARETEAPLALEGNYLLDKDSCRGSHLPRVLLVAHLEHLEHLERRLDHRR